MLYPFSKFFWVVVRPGNLLVLLLAMGAALLWRRAPLRWPVTVLAALLAALIVVPAGRWAIAPLDDRFPPPVLPGHVDGIILLGGAVNLGLTAAHGQVALDAAAARITATLALARPYPDAPVLVSGGDTAVIAPAGITEAKVTGALLAADGLEPQRLLLEDRSRNTYENAVDSRALAKPRPGQIWLLVTSAFHMPRAVGCFRAVGWSVLPFPVDYRSGGSRGLDDLSVVGELGLFEVALHEWVGLAAYRLLGRSAALFPAPAAAATSP